MDKSNRLLSELVTFRTYAKHLPTLGRREMYDETIARSMNMHLERFPKLSRDIVKSFEKVFDYKVCGSMRMAQFAGEPILRNNARGYNCAFMHIDSPEAFGEMLFLLLSGTGVGFSVQRRHVNKLPVIQQPQEESVFYVADSIAGWAEALNALMFAYFFNRTRPQFNLSLVRPKGQYLITTGAKAPGPLPLKQMLEDVEKMLKEAVGRRLRPIECHDLACRLADCVLVGGIRRAALISLFDAADTELLEAKHGNWWEKHPYRARANNSAVLKRDSVTKEQFRYIYDKCIESNSGEPGIAWTNDVDMGLNPCAEISLQNGSFCNLTSINLTGIKDEKDWMNRVYAAAMIGTLQASYTTLPFLRPHWKETTELEALLGCSITGIADAGGIMTAEMLQKGAKHVLEVNEKYAKKIGINTARRACTIKPEGSASCTVGSSSGIHARHSAYYLRRIRINKNDALAMYLLKAIPELIEDDVTSATSIVVTIPQKSPFGAITREMETAKSLFERDMFYQDNWVNFGHLEGKNKHNVSVTISYRPDEIEELFELMWENRHRYTAISLLPYSDHTYMQAPFEECSVEIYNKYNEMVQDVDFSQVIEFDDNTERSSIVACQGNFCEVI